MVDSSQGAVESGRSRETKRVQMELPPASMDRLTALKDKTEAASYAEVVRNALRLYEAMIQEVESGKEVMLRDKNTKELTAYRIFA